MIISSRSLKRLRCPSLVSSTFCCSLTRTNFDYNMESYRYALLLSWYTDSCISLRSSIQSLWWLKALYEAWEPIFACIDRKHWSHTTEYRFFRLDWYIFSLLTYLSTCFSQIFLSLTSDFSSFKLSGFKMGVSSRVCTIKWIFSPYL